MKMKTKTKTIDEYIEKVWTTLDKLSEAHVKNMKDHEKFQKDIEKDRKSSKEKYRQMEKMHKNDFIELKNMHKEIAQSQKDTDRRMKETDRLIKENARRIKETSQQMKETDQHLKEKFSELKVYVGNVGRNNGDVAEEFFYHTLAKDMKLDKYKFDVIQPNVRGHIPRKNIQGEYDIVLHNSNVIVIVEVKYKVHSNDIVDFKEKKLPTFRKLFPDKKDFKIYGAIAGMAFPLEFKKKALDNGLLVLTQGGGRIKVEKSKVQNF